MASLNVGGPSIRFKNLLVVIKQTAFEEYSQVRSKVVFVGIPSSLAVVWFFVLKAFLTEREQQQTAFSFSFSPSVRH